MNRTQRQRQRRVAAAIATTATISVGGIAVSLDTAAGDPLVLPPVTTIPGDPIGPIPEVDLLPTTTTSTTAPSSSSTTTTSTTSTTTTTVPSGSGGSGTTHTVGQQSNSGSQPWTELGTSTSKTGRPHEVPAAAAGGAALPAVPAATLPDAVQPAPVAAANLRSPVLLDEVPEASISLPVAGRSTKSILNVLFGLELPPATLAKVLAPFPVAGEATYSDDWHAPRFTPQAHDHEGTDVFAAKGTPVVASAGGVVTTQPDSAVGGNTMRLTQADGTYYYYAHLDRFAVGIESGKKVDKGDIIGFVGRTGNAEGGKPHLHFEIHPGGGEAVPPVPYLDRWLSEAMATASTLRAQPGAADSLVTLRPARGKGSDGKTVDALLRPASSARPLPEGTTLDPSSGLEISGVVLFLMWMFRRFRRRIASRQEG